LNGAERHLQHSLRNACFFNGLLIACVVAAAYASIRALPDRRPRADATTALTYRPVDLEAAESQLRIAGAWEVDTGDRRFGGLSSLSWDQNRFIAVSDLGAVVRFDPPDASTPIAEIKDLRAGPGPWGKKWTRDAESLAPDPKGRGWWIGYEQHHSVWLYDPRFDRALANSDLKRDDWLDNRGAEAMVADGDDLLVLAENGRDAMRVGPSGIRRLPLEAGADVAEAARAPDGSIWLLLRSYGGNGISQRVAPLVRTEQGYGVGQGLMLPKARFDNFEGMAIAPLPAGGWRFWLVSDNGRRGMAPTLLVALDYAPPARHDKSPATGAGLSK
jgi:hypothetical protein